MSYDVRIIRKKDGVTVKFKNKHDIHGGTYAVGGTDLATLNITYNYAPWFYKLWPEPADKKEKDKTTPFGQMFGKTDGGLRSLYNKPLDEVIDSLAKAADKLTGDPDDDYWKASEGNARKAIMDLLEICRRAKSEEEEAELTLVGD